MDFSVIGEEDTKERFRRYLASNPAARRGWVNVGDEGLIAVSEDYIDPFREIAANFGLEVDPAEPEAMQ
jgi:hypothetical protein